MMNRELHDWMARPLRGLAVGLALAVASQSLAAMEEISVDGAKEAAQARAQRAFFASEMAAYRKSVGVEYKGTLKADLERAVRNEARLAAADARSRG